MTRGGEAAEEHDVVQVAGSEVLNTSVAIDAARAAGSGRSSTAADGAVQRAVARSSRSLQIDAIGYIQAIGGEEAAAVKGTGSDVVNSSVAIDEARVRSSAAAAEGAGQSAECS